MAICLRVLAVIGVSQENRIMEKEPTVPLQIRLAKSLEKDATKLQQNKKFWDLQGLRPC